MGTRTRRPKCCAVAVSGQLALPKDVARWEQELLLPVLEKLTTQQQTTIEPQSMEEKNAAND